MPTLQPLNTAAIPKRMSMVIWGEAGCGKTVFANTAPGKRILINFDPDGHQSIPRDEHTLLFDVSNEPNSYVVEQAKLVNPFDIEGMLKNNPDVETVIADSMTKFAERATINAIGKAPGSTFENPGIGSYGYRNRYTLQLVSNLLLATGKLNKHIIFICHEDVPKTNEKGEIQSITILLGGSLPVEVPLQISEVWHMRDNGSERSVVIRNVGLRRPMKTRMFDTASGIEFTTSTKTQPSKVRLDSLFEAWRANNYNKIPVPK